MGDLEGSRRNIRAVIPSIFTIGNMGFGFFSILASGNSNFVMAAWFIILAILMDMLDGRIARLVRGESSFGIEIDSLSDWLSFGIAPAYLIYGFGLKSYGVWAYPVVFFYVLCGALRLARFNVKAHFRVSEERKKFFQGLPIPGAAGILASFILVYSLIEVQDPARGISWIMNRMPFIYGILPFLIIFLSLLMISSIPYGAFKSGSVFKPKSISFLFFVVAAIFFIVAYPQNSLFLFFFLYVVSGVVMFIFKSLVSVKSRIYPETKEK